MRPERWKEFPMATIIGFSKWTDQGVRNYRETVDRLEQAKELAKRFDAEITATYWTPGGPYDMITVLEASDTRKAAALALQVEALGNLRMMRVEAYGPDEMRKVIPASG
jgi:uncharacterized protein with GYD domain